MKNEMTNLFSNFPKNHLNTTGHVRDYYQQKGISFLDHPQGVTTKSNPMVITLDDHKNMGNEGIGIVATMNESLDL